MADDFPIQPVLSNSPSLQNPDYGEQSPGALTALGKVAGTAFMDTTGAQGVETFANSLYGSFMATTDLTQPVPYDKAVQMLKQGNYDASGVPKAGWTGAALMTEMQRQERDQDARLAASRANLSNTSQFVAGVAGGLGDPITLAAGPLLGRVSALAKVGAVGRAAIGGAEGASLVGGEEALQNHLEGHDEDSLSWTMLRDVTLSAAPGALLHSAFGAKALARPGEPLSLDAVAALERSDAAAKAQGVSVDNVVSPTGAVGKYQVEPATAKALGIEGDLHDPAVNRAAAAKLLDQLAGRYGNDPEAIAVAYNAGPRRADDWIKRGRDDSVLPRETQDYLSRLRGVPYEARENAGRLAVTQLSNDSPVDVKPVADFRTNPFKIQDEHDAEVSQLHTQAMQDAVPKQDAMFTQSSDTAREAMEATPQANPELEHYNSAVQAAQERVGGLGPDAMQTFKEQMAENEKTPEFGTLQHDDVTKAVQAAVQCGVMKGLQYGAD